MCETVVGVGKEKLGLKERHRGNTWFDADCVVAAERRKKCRMKWLEDRNNDVVFVRETFREARRNAVSVNRRKKRQALDRDLREIEENSLRGHTRAQYQGISKIRKGYQPRQELIRDTRGNILVNKDDINARGEIHDRPDFYLETNFREILGI